MNICFCLQGHKELCCPRNPLLWPLSPGTERVPSRGWAGRRPAVWVTPAQLWLLLRLHAGLIATTPEQSELMRQINVPILLLFPPWPSRSQRRHIWGFRALATGCLACLTPPSLATWLLLLFSLTQASPTKGRERISGVFGVWTLDMGARLPITRGNEHPHWREGEPKARKMGWPALGPPAGLSCHLSHPASSREGYGAPLWVTSPLPSPPALEAMVNDSNKKSSDNSGNS